jgi:hypothetical protein
VVVAIVNELREALMLVRLERRLAPALTED